jgi:phospholipid-binding lipoprotein MlaA
MQTAGGVPLRNLRTLFGLAAAAALASCAAAPYPDSLDFDPFERENRINHELNREIDRTMFGPVARAWGTNVPQPVRRGITNLRFNWKLPGETIQYALQGRPEHSARAALRFAVNTTFGLGGILDPAKEMDLEHRETNTDETFFVWGIPEGGYVELPFGGPGTQRDWTGWVIDIVLDPAFLLLPVPGPDVLVGAGALDIVNDRYELDTVIEELLYSSEDSYTAQRITYLQNMRARLQGGTNVEQLEDIYADF